MRRALGLDPRMIRFSVVKLGDKLGGREQRTKVGRIEDTEGEAYKEWQGQSYDTVIASFMERHVGRRGAGGPSAMEGLR